MGFKVADLLCLLAGNHDVGVEGESAEFLISYIFQRKRCISIAKMLQVNKNVL